MLTVRAIEHIHGHLGTLACVLMVHPALLLGRRPAGSRLVWPATILLTVVCLSGLWIYGDYRELIQRPLFRETRGLGLLFERKEHLALGSLAMAWLAAVVYARAPESLAAQTLSRRVFGLSAALGILVALFGMIVAVQRGF
jgi:hypothetical protein